ncbi:N-acetyl-D-Glu racemase DgcA [Rhodanobacter lindaniclasticus]
MLRQLIIEERRFPLAVPFRISRGVKLNADVVTVAMYQGDKCGRGEAVPYARYGESVASVIEQMEQLRPQLASGMGRDELLAQLPAGAARNALDAAMWDLESQLSGVPVWQRLARTPGTAVVTALTVGIDTPEQMGVAAARIAGVGLIKVKVDADDPAARIDAVRRAAPHARLIVDPNESWTIDLLRDMQGPLARARVDLLEQPLPADADDALLAFSGSVPICADEACHETRDLPRMRGRYQAINIKLDKTGGLTEAWRLLRAARSEGFKVMIGCMVCSSLGIAPALELAREAAFVDLDGPFWLQHDHPDGVQLQGGSLLPPPPGFWGG